MSNLVWIISPLALIGAFFLWQALKQAPVPRHLTNVVLSLVLLVYFAATAGLGIFWVARQQLPVFEPHYLFGYAAVLLATLHVTFNAPIVLRTFFGPPRKRTRPPSGPPRWILLAFLLTAVGCGAFTAGARYGASTSPAETSSSASTSQNASQQQDFVRWYHEVSSESRTRALTRGAVIPWKKPPRYKTYPDSLPRMSLPPPEPPAHARSVDAAVIEGPRAFDSPPSLDIDGLSVILHHTAGITQRRGGLDLRAAPSSGALFPTELYVAVHRVDGLAEGLYHYDPENHGLTQLLEGSPSPAQLGHAASIPAPATLIATAVFARTGVKYGHRAYRYILADVGHLVENVRVAAGEIGFGACPLPAFEEQRVVQTLSLNPVDEGPLAVIPLAERAPCVSPDTLAPVSDDTQHPLGPTGRMHMASSLGSYGIEEPTVPAEAIPFPEPTTAPLGVWNAIESRRSGRNYAKTPMSRSELGSLIHTMTRPSPILSRHLVVWVIVHRVEGLASGVYRYDRNGHGLVAKRLGDLSSATESAVLSQQMAANAAAVIVLGIRGSDVVTMGARAYRHAWLEVGMVGQRAYLDATGRGLAVCAAGAFFDDEVSDLLGVERDEWPAHFVMVGRR